MVVKLTKALNNLAGFGVLLTSAAVSAEAMKSYDNSALCRNSFDYAIYFSGIRTGSMQRYETFDGHQGSVESYSRASILGIGTKYHQKAQFVYRNNTFLTQTFHQKVSGFRSRDMLVSFSESGLQSEVNLNGELTSYDNPAEPLRDMDTLSLQLREWVKQGLSSFTLTRQASDGPEPYQYQVTAAQRMTVEPWGELEVIQVEQTRAETVTYWFSPKLDYQLVKATYHGFLFNGGLELKSMTLGCEETESSI